MAQLHVGDQAPDFTLPATGGKSVTLSDLRGRNVVLYFYPKDDTPGCTQEACDFRDRSEEFGGLNTVILGVSTDPLPSHEKFIAKYGLPFTLLSDPEHQVHDLYGAWGEKNMYGRTYFGTIRSTFVIDREGVIRFVDPKVHVGGHVERVLEFIRAELGGQA